MKPIVLRSPAAKIDLSDIWIFIANDNIYGADRVLDAIDTRCHLIAAQPMLGRHRPDLGGHIRSHPVGEYVVFYRPIDKEIRSSAYCMGRETFRPFGPGQNHDLGNRDWAQNWSLE